MKSAEQYLEMCRSAAQDVTPEQPVRAVGLLGRARTGTNRARGFPNNVMMAVTPTRIMSFEYRPRPDRIKILRKVADWPRSAVDVEIDGAGQSQRLSFRLIDGSNFELDSPRSFERYDRLNAPFFAALGLATPA